MMTASTTSSHLRTLDMAHIAVFVVLMSICAWITVPLPKPLVQSTLQTFVVFMALTTLGGLRGLYAMVVYLLLGVVGIPVFSGFRGGVGVLLDTSGGYIIGFVAAALVYWLLTAKTGEPPLVKAAACVFALVVCHAFGVVWFLMLYTRTTGPIEVTTALAWCVFPKTVAGNRGVWASEKVS